MSGDGYRFSYAGPETEAATDGRLFPPTFPRNSGPIGEVLTRLIGDLRGMAVEIGAGTGQHAAHYARLLPDLVWQPTDMQPEHRASIAAWVRHAGLPNLLDPLDIDATADWPADPALAARAAEHGPVRAVFAQNVCHIAPWDATLGILGGASRLMGSGGRAIFYGPFRIDGVHVGPGNAAFDADLRRRDPGWGIRDTADMTRAAARAGFGPAEIVEMPANNRILAFTRA